MIPLLALAAHAAEFAPTLPSGSKWTITEEVGSSLPWEGGSLGSRTVTITDLHVRQGGAVGRDRIAFDAEISGLRSEEMRGAETSVWDSTGKAKPDENQAIYAALVGDTWSAALDASGEATATVDAKAFEKRLLAHGIEKDMVPLLSGLMGAEARAAQAKQLLWQLPRGELAVGDTWTSTVEDKSGVPLGWKWKLRSVQDGVATFDLGVEVPPMPLIEDLNCSGVAITEVTGAPRSVTVDCSGKNTAVGATQTIRTSVTWSAR